MNNTFKHTRNGVTAERINIATTKEPCLVLMKKLLFTIMACSSVLLVGCSQANLSARRQGSSAVAGEWISSSDEVIAQTQSGKVAGYIDNGIYIYKGIPYAKAERFMAPQAPDSWEGVRSSRAYGPTCPQAKRTGWYSDEQAFSFNWNDGFADEDCLRVNIWTQGLSDGKKRPVMVWLHGGGFAAGSGQELPSYDGTNLARKGDVVVVTLNHRLNVLGFLDLSAFGEKYAHSGNVGLLDLVAALQWVKNNIEHFGGDPSNVTIFGQSGGGGKVSTLLATPSANGLFHKAIVQSGSQLTTMEANYSRRIGVAVAQELGIKASDIDALQKVPYEQLLAAGDKAIAKVRVEAEKEGFSPFIFGWGPTVDGDVLPVQPFAGHAPEQSKNIPMIIGTTVNEFCMSAFVPAMRNLGKDQIMEQLRQKYGDRTDEFVKAFAKAYPDYRPVDLTDVDVMFRPMALAQGALKSAQNGAKVYMYLFTWQSPVLNGVLRAVHCMEIPFVFDNAVVHAGMTGGGAQAQALAEKMSGAWINFARTGDPNGSGLPQWEPYTAEKGATMLFDNDCVVKYNHDKDLMEIARAFPMRGF